MKLTILGGDGRSIRLAYLLEEDGHDVGLWQEDHINKLLLSHTLMRHWISPV